jgi:hypothetical protein
MAISRAPKLIALMLAPFAAQAADAPPADQSPPMLEQLEDRARRAFDLFADDIETLMHDLGEGLDRLNDYGPPQALPNGDILIPRRRPPPTAPHDAPIDL